MKVWKVGDSASVRRLIGPDEIDSFVKLSGDNNPVHTDPAAARAAGFDGTIAHGMIAGSMFSGLLGNDIPGPGSIYLQQNFKFLAPVYVPSEVVLVVDVVAVREDQKIITVRTRCFAESGELCVDGEAILLRRAVTGGE
jgi:acyl dehydratase